MSSETYPFSFPQQAILLDALLHGPATNLNVSGAIVIRGDLDAALFRRAIEFASREHDAHRLRIRLDGSEPRQEFVSEAECRLETLDFSGCSHSFQSAADFVRTENARPIALDEFPLCSDFLIRLDDRLHLWQPKIHHIANDGSGHALVTETMAAAYNGLLADGRLPERKRFSYADFIREDRAYAASARFREDEAFWQAKFSAMPEPLPFTARKGRLTGDVRRTERCTLSLSRLVYNSARKRCEAAGITPFQLLLAALFAYLHRVTGRDDMVIGTPILNRSNHAFRRTAGMFMNMMPLRIAIDKGGTLLGVARQIAHELRSCYRHQRFPLSETVRHCRTLDGFCHGVYDVTLVYSRFSYDLNFGEASARTVSFDTHSHAESLVLEVDEYNDDEDIDLSFNHHPKLISAEEVRYIARAFEALLVDFAVAYDRPLAELRLIAEPGAAAAAGRPRAVESTVLDLFARHAAENPDAPAIVDGATRMTYGELARASGRVAAFLARECGVEPEQPVAVLCARNAEWISALLGIMQAGGTYLPLDPGAPRDRLEFILRDSGCRLLLAGAGHAAEEFPDVCSVRIGDALRSDAPAPDRKVGARSLAYIIYTSGTTGLPKGVLVEHAGLANTAAEQARGWDLEPEDAFLQFAASMFDASIAEVFAALAAGSRLVIASREVILEPAALLELLSRENVTVAILPPAYLSALGRAPLPSLRLLGTAGEEANPADVAHYNRSLAYINAYGPTETSICASFLRLEAGAAFAGERVPIGKPLPNTGIYILDENLQWMPPGAEGEICVGGVNVARGYLNRPDLTASRFVPNPFRQGERMYRTGDIGRQLPDGNIEFLGRRDTQVKVRGYRVELGEIEALLQTHPSVETAVVASGTDGGLTAYVVSRGDFLPGDLRRRLASKLPAYMVPSRWVPMPALPLNSSGKVDRGALPAPPALEDGPETTEVPLSECQKTIARAFEEVLGCGPVPPMTEFFELGGHSLLALQLASRLRDAFGLTVPVLWVFEAPTVIDLARRIELALAAEAGTDHPEVCAIPVASRGKPLPLSFAQQRLWFLDQLEGPNPAYNMPGALAITGPLDTTALQLALSEIVRRHDTLRTCLAVRDGEPVQVIAPASAAPLSLLDLRGTEDPDAEASRLARQEAVKPFDLANQVPLRAQLLRRRNAAWTLLLTLHHSAADGWSISILIRELLTLYTAFHEGRPSPLPELAIQYADYAIWQRGYLSGERLARELDYWRTTLAGAPDCLNLPTDRPRPPRQTYRGASIQSAIDAELTAGLQELSRRSGATLFMTLLAAWSALLGRYSGEDDIVVGSPVANRTQSAIESLIGFFANILALRASLSGNPPFLELLGRVRQLCLDAYAHQELPFESLIESLSLTRDLAHAPLFQVMFVLQNTAREPLVLPGLEIALKETGSAVAKFDLTLSVAETDGALAATLECATDLFDRATIERLSGHFVQLLRSAIAHPERSIGELDILSPAEKQQLLVDWNATASPLPEQCVQQMFEARVASAPDAVAVVFEGRTLTYRELNSRANQLAHALIALGVSADHRVAIALERSPAMIVALLATLKAGGAYVPLDPEYPAERLAFMLEDSGARILITQARLRQPLLQIAGHTLCLDTLWDTVAVHPESNPDRPVAPEHLAYIIYTSGSTGKPKGVAVEHRGLSNLAEAQIRQFGVAPDSHVLQFASFSFDASISEIAMALCSGASLHLPDAGQRMPGPSLWQYLNDSGITHVTLPPTALAALPQAALPKLASIIVAGEPCAPGLAAFWAKGRRFFNAYGPTEATVCATAAECAADQIASTAPLPIGRPLDNVRLYVLDRHNQPVPAGVPGELHIGGVGLARGYLNRPELTAERFIPDPLGSTQGARLYRTGDLARYRPDGNLEFLGRLDEQVKIRGFRIELGEIETALAGHPGIREAVVMARSEAGGEKRLVAYIVPAGDQPAPGELRSFLKETLPDYMLPAAWVFLPALPLSSNGKVNRKALPEPESPVTAGRAAPRDALEETVAGIWETVLDQGAPGIHDNFFELGGHSLLATHLSARLYDALNTTVPVRWIFEAPTVAELADRIRASGQNGDSPVVVPASRITPGTSRLTPDLLPLITLEQSAIDLVVRSVEGGEGNVQDIYPLAPLQEGVLFHHLLESTGDVYLAYSLLAFDSRARCDALLTALQASIDRHDILRTSVVWEQLPEPVQVVWRRATLPVEVRHFDPARGPIPEQLVECCHPRHTRLDLTRAPLLRAVPAQDGERWLMLFLTHHLILDHTALEVLVEEIAAHIQGDPGQLSRRCLSATS